MGNNNIKYSYNKVMDGIRKLINDGKILPGQRLPSFRELANRFGVSSYTVSTAIERLSYEGIVDVRSNSGVYVASDAWRELNPKTVEWKEYLFSGLHQPTNRLRKAIEHKRMVLSSITMPEDAPWFELIRSATEQAFASIRRANMLNDYNDYIGFYPLRESVCQHLKQYGIDAPPDEVFITQGLLDGIHLISLAFFRGGMNCYYEHPSYFDITSVLHYTGINMLPVPLDEEGISFEYITSKLQRNQKSVIVTYPTEQYPTR